VRHENAALLTISSALIAHPSGRDGMFLLIATKTGWEDRLSLLPIWDEWQKQTVDARLLFVEDSIGYIYLDFVEHCEGARPSVYPPSLLRSSQPVDSPAACASVSCLPPQTHTIPRPPRATSCSEPLGGAQERLEREA
jgi:hypothetical protein